MIIKKVLNNNAAIVVGEKNEDLVVTGLGLAFQKKIGDELDEDKLERIFRMESKETSKKLQDLIRDIPVEYFDITEEIVVLVKNNITKNINENIYLTLTDHICFAVERIKKGYDLKNPLAWEISRFYSSEYQIGSSALKIIENKFGVALPKDEAASIAMHIVNAELNVEMSNGVKLVKILQDELTIIKYHFGIEFDENSLAYQRLVTHLKFFAQRVINGEKEVNQDNELFKMVVKQYPKAYECALKIGKYIYEKHNYQVQDSELTYIIVHIERNIQNHKVN